MGRIARVVVPGLVHHVTQRGNHQQDVFFSNSDRDLYLTLVREYSHQYGVAVLGYCLMTNHVHLLVVPERANSLAKGIGLAHNAYSRWLQVRQRRTGHLWQNRFYSCVMAEEDSWAVLRYVEVNPVRAKMVERASEWAWSSARAHLSGRDATEILAMEQWARRYDPARWHEVLEQGVTEAAWAERIREATRTGRPFGTEAFVAELERQTGRRLRPKKRGPHPKAKAAGAGEQRQTSFEVA